MEIALEFEVLLLVFQIFNGVKFLLELVQLVRNPVLDVRLIVHLELRLWLTQILHGLHHLDLHLLDLALQLIDKHVFLTVGFDHRFQFVTLGLLVQIQFLDEGHKLLFDNLT